jgi:hypothetical protein
MGQAPADGRRSFAAFAEHERIVNLARAERRDAKGVDAQPTELQVPLQMGIQNATATNDTDTDHACCS